MEAVASYLRQTLPSCTIGRIGAASNNLLLLRTSHSAVGIAAGTDERDGSYLASYGQYKEHFLKNEKSPLIDPAFVFLVSEEWSGDLERFSSVVRSDYCVGADGGTADLRVVRAQTSVQRSKQLKLKWIRVLALIEPR
jgi:hypothetical protein